MYGLSTLHQPVPPDKSCVQKPRVRDNDMGLKKPSLAAESLYTRHLGNHTPAA
jgi:hypothetical protein